MDNKLFILAVIFLCLAPATAAPAWWNASLDTRRAIENTGTTSYGYPVNATSAFCGQPIWVNPTLCGDTCYIYYNTANPCADWTVANTTARVPFDKDLNSYGGYLPSTVWSKAQNIYHCGNGTTNATFLHDSLNAKNGTASHAWSSNTTGQLGAGTACYFDGVYPNGASVNLYPIPFNQSASWCTNVLYKPIRINSYQRIFNFADGTISKQLCMQLAGTGGGNDNKWRFLWNDGTYRSFYSDYATTNNSWVLVTMCNNGTGQEMFINGTRQAASNNLYIPTWADSSDYISGYSAVNDEGFQGYIDDFQIFVGSNIPNGTYWSELWSAIQGTKMTLSSPESHSTSSVSLLAIGTTYDANLTARYYFNATDRTTTPCYKSLDLANFTSIGNATNATLTDYNFVTTLGNHTLNITCEATGGNVTDSISFSVIDSAFINQQYNTPEYETNSSVFGLQVNTSSRVQSINASLSWNGTALSTNGNAVGSLWSFNVSKPVPLITINHTIPVFWNYTINLANGTNYTQGAPDLTIGLFQSYIITVINNTPPVVLEGDQITLQSQISKTPVNNATIDYVYFMVGGTPYLASLNGSTATYSIYSVSLYAPVATGGSTPYNATFTLSFNGTSLNKTSSTTSYTVSPIEFTNCSAGSNSTTPFITYKFYNEENITQALNSTLEVTYSVIKNTVSKEFNFTSPVNTTYSNCFSPANATILTNATIKYYATGYSTRYYYLSNALLTNASTTVPLYLLSNTSSTNFVFYLVDTNRNPVKGAILDIQRFYVSLNQFIAVAMGQTDYAAGATNINLLASENLYAVTVIQGGVNTSFLYPISLTSSSITLTLSPQSFDQYSARSAYISSSCSSTNTTLSCTYSDSSGLSPTVKLYVLRTFALANITACSTNVTATAGTLICSISNTTSTTYSYALTADYSDGMHLVLQTGSLSYAAPPQFQGAQGLLLTAIIVIAGAFLTINSPSVGVVLTLLALTTAKMLWLVNISSEALAALYVIGLLLIYRLKW